MPIKDTATHRILSNIIQTTFGKQTEVRNPTHFLSLEIPTDGYIKAKFLMIVRIGHQHNQLEFMKYKYQKEAVNYISTALKKVAEQYKEAVESKEKLLEPKEEPYEKKPKKSIKLVLDENTLSDTYEFVSPASLTALKTAYYRVQVYAKIE